MTFDDGKFVVPETMVPQILKHYHDSPDSGGDDRFWKTYRKVSQRFHWKHMKDDVKRYVQYCHQCQDNKVKHLHTADKLILPEHSTVPCEFVNVDLSEVGGKKTRSKKNSHS